MLQEDINLLEKNKMVEIKTTEKRYAHELNPALEVWLKEQGYTKIIYERTFPTYSRSTYSVFDVMAAKPPKKHDKYHNNFSMIGIEIKSDQDSLSRLEKQIPDYMDAFDQVYLLLDSRKKPYHPLIGILRYENGKVVCKKKCLFFPDHRFNILSSSETIALCKSHGLSVKDANKIHDALEILPGIRRKLIYNRFFAKMDWDNQYISEHVKFNKKELEFILNLGIEINFQVLKSQANQIKQTVNGIIKICDITKNMSKFIKPIKPVKLKDLDINTEEDTLTKFIEKSKKNKEEDDTNGDTNL